MRSVLVWLRRRWQAPVLEAIEVLRGDVARLSDDHEAIVGRLAELDGRLDQLDADIAAESEALAERVVAERRRLAGLADEVVELRDRIAGS